MLSRLVAVLMAIAVVAGARVASAQTIAEFWPARAVGFAGARSLASGVEAIFLNPGALGYTSGYTLQADYGHVAAESTDLPVANGLVVSLVDSKTNPNFPTGLSYRYVWITTGATKTQGSVYDFALAAKLLGPAALGIHLQYLSYTGVSTFTGDLGIGVPLGPVSFNITGFNLITSQATTDAPRGGDVGAAAGDGKVFKVGFDFTREWPNSTNRWISGESPRNLYTVGAEVSIAQMVPVRAGLLWNTAEPKIAVPQFVTVGTGFYFNPVGFDASYQREIANGENSFVFAVKVFQ